MSITETNIENIVEAALFAADQPLSIDKLFTLFSEADNPSKEQIKCALDVLIENSENRGVLLKEVGTGFRYVVKQEYAPWISRMWEERPPRYSRALLETLALIVYRQPITRAEIEDIRGVSVSTSIMKTLQERDWVRIVGHRDVPGKPALYATTKEFLDYFNIKSLGDLPTLAEIRNLDKVQPELVFENSEKDLPKNSSVPHKSDPILNVDKALTTDLTELESASDLNVASDLTVESLPQQEQQVTVKSVVN